MKKIRAFFIFAVLVIFIAMNGGVYKNNDMVTSLSVICFSWASLALLLMYKGLPQYNIKPKAFAISLTGIFFLFLILQAIIVYNIPLGYYSDFIVIREQAISLSEGFHIKSEYEQYFNMYPYQINIAVLINWIYRMVGDYHRVELVSAAIVNLSAILAAITVKNLTGNRFLAIIVAAFSEIFSLFCLKTYLPYTNNIGEIFPILCICVYTSNIKSTKKIILMAIIAVVGTWVKITTIIPYLGICIIEGIRFIKSKEYKNISIALATLALMFASLSTLHHETIKRLNFNQEPSWKHGFVYFLAMGQNNQASGQFYKPIGIIGDQYYSTKTERDKIFWNIATRSIKERGVVEQIKFFLIKISYCWGEVRQDHLNFSSYDKLILILRHYVWYFALLMMTLGAFLICDRKYYAFLMGILGVVAYLYLSEAGARYVIMYSPIVFVMMGWAIHAISRKTEVSIVKTDCQ